MPTSYQITNHLSRVDSREFQVYDVDTQQRREHERTKTHLGMSILRENSKLSPCFYLDTEHHLQLYASTMGHTDDGSHTNGTR